MSSNSVFLENNFVWKQPICSLSVQFSLSVVSDSLWPDGLQHARPPCPSPTPGVYSISCSLCQWCHPAISSSVVPLSSRPQSFPASESFPMSQFFTSSGQSIDVSASASVLPMNIQDWIHIIALLYCAHLCMRCSLGIFNFLEEISSLSHPVVFLYFFALIAEEGFLISPCYSLEFWIQMLIIFPFLLCFSFLFFSQLFVRPPQTAILLFCICFSWGWPRSLSPV